MINLLKPWRWFRGNRWGVGLRLAILCLLGVMVWGMTELSRWVVPVSTGKVPVGVDVSQPYFIAEFPAVEPISGYAGQPAHIFYIPKAFVYFRGIALIQNNGRFEKLPIEYELPDKTPRQTRRYIHRDAPEYESHLKTTTTLGFFSANLAHGHAHYEIADFLRRVNGYYSGNFHHKPDENIMLDGEPYGLVRYSAIACHDSKRVTTTDPKDLLDPAIQYDQQFYKESMADRPTDDPVTKPFCRIDRANADLFTPPESTPVDQQVFITCRTASCVASVNITEHIGVRVSLWPRDLPRWREITQGTRELVQSFMQRPPDLIPTQTQGAITSGALPRTRLLELPPGQ